MNLLVFSILTVVCLNEISATILDVEACHEIGKTSKTLTVNINYKSRNHHILDSHFETQISGHVFRGGIQLFF